MQLIKRLILEQERSIIPIEQGEKRPAKWLGPTEPFIYTRATESQIEEWASREVMSWGMFAGKVSGNVAVMDFDDKWSLGQFEKFMNKLPDDLRAIVATCVITRTRNSGWHLICRTETTQHSTVLAKGFRLTKEGKLSSEAGAEMTLQTLIETRGEGNYALIPPSPGYAFEQGNLMNIPLISDEMWEELCDIARTFNEVEDEPEPEPSTYSTSNYSGERPGDIFNSTATWEKILEPFGWHQKHKGGWVRPGKDKNSGISATTDYESRPLLYVFSTNATPFKAEKGYTKFTAYTMLYHNGDFRSAAKALAQASRKNSESADDSLGSNMATILANMVLLNDDATLFKDQLAMPYVRIKVDEHFEIWPIESKTLRQWLEQRFFKSTKKIPSAEALKSAISLLAAHAHFQNTSHHLYNRVGKTNDAYWYDLGDNKCRAIKIDASGWSVEDHPPILFRRHKHQQEQVTPDPGGDVHELLKYVNVHGRKAQLLYLVTLLMYYIPGFPHVILYVFGPQGSSKSTLSKVSRSMIDPSQMAVGTMPTRIEEMVQVLAHHSFLFFDNVSWIEDIISDLLCKAVTGSGFSKRELYTNDDDFIYDLLAHIGINGINVSGHKPDLLERCVLLKLEAIRPENRKAEDDIMKEFMEQKPKILGGIFTALAKAVEIYPTVVIEKKPRMADYAKWGCAIAEALGYSQQEFLDAYSENVQEQVIESIVDDPVVHALRRHMRWTNTSSRRTIESVEENTASRWLEIFYAALHESPIQDSLPKNAASLGKHLNRIAPNLAKIGYTVDHRTTALNRFIKIIRTASEHDNSDSDDGENSAF